MEEVKVGGTGGFSIVTQKCDDGGYQILEEERKEEEERY